MARVELSFETVTLSVNLRDTDTARRIAAATPFSARVQTWGDEVYFETPVDAEPEDDARDVMTLGEVAFWLAGSCIAIGYGRTPVSRGDEIRLASAVNIWGDAEIDPAEMRKIAPGSKVSVTVRED